LQLRVFQGVNCCLEFLTRVLVLDGLAETVRLRISLVVVHSKIQSS